MMSSMHGWIVGLGLKGIEKVVSYDVDVASFYLFRFLLVKFIGLYDVWKRDPLERAVSSCYFYFNPGVCHSFS